MCLTMFHIVLYVSNFETFFTNLQHIAVISFLRLLKNTLSICIKIRQIFFATMPKKPRDSTFFFAPSKYWHNFCYNYAKLAGNKVCFFWCATGSSELRSQKYHLSLSAGRRPFRSYLIEISRHLRIFERGAGFRIPRRSIGKAAAAESYIVIGVVE